VAAVASLLGLVAAAAPPVAPKERWCIWRTLDENNNPVLVTSNLGYRKFSAKATLPWLVQVNLTTVNQNKYGHPTNEEAVILNQVEDRITAALKHAVEAHYIGRATTKGARELVYYVRDAEAANALLSKLSKAPTQRAWEYRIAKDPKWERAEDLIGGDLECL
jgi:hypothetical protein